MPQTHGMFAVISGKVLLQAASSHEEIEEAFEKWREAKGFEVAVAFDRYTNAVVKMEAHKELRWKLEEREKARKAAPKKVSEPEVPEVKGWTL